MIFLTILGGYTKIFMRIAILSMMALIIFTTLFEIVGFNESPYAEICLLAVSLSTSIAIEIIYGIFCDLK
jgi:hypothetical protein